MDREDYIDFGCSCLEGDFCPHAGKRLVGRLWQLSQMSDNLGKQYRAMWFDKAQQNQVKKGGGVGPTTSFRQTRSTVTTKPCGCNKNTDAKLH